MWICFNDGFVSAVAHNSDPNMLVVRARKREHLETLFPNHEIVVYERSDYAARIFITKDEYADFVADRIRNIDYGNFKNSVEDDRLHKLYEDIWYLGYQYQNYD